MRVGVADAAWEVNDVPDAACRESGSEKRNATAKNDSQNPGAKTAIGSARTMTRTANAITAHGLARMPKSVAQHTMVTM